MLRGLFILLIPFGSSLRLKSFEFTDEEGPKRAPIPTVKAVRLKRPSSFRNGPCFACRPKRRFFSDFQSSEEFRRMPVFLASSTDHVRTISLLQPSREFQNPTNRVNEIHTAVARLLALPVSCRACLHAHSSKVHVP